MPILAPVRYRGNIKVENSGLLNTLPFDPWGTRDSMYYMKFFIVLLYKATYWQIRENTANPTLLTNRARQFDIPVIV